LASTALVCWTLRAKKIIETTNGILLFFLKAASPLRKNKNPFSPPAWTGGLSSSSFLLSVEASTEKRKGVLLAATAASKEQKVLTVRLEGLGYVSAQLKP